jgi:hypothetical protein
VSRRPAEILLKESLEPLGVSQVEAANRARHTGQGVPVERTVRRRAPHEAGKPCRRRQRSAWVDAVGPHAAADKPPETWFPARRSRFAEWALPVRDPSESVKVVVAGAALRS